MVSTSSSSTCDVTIIIIPSPQHPHTLTSLQAAASCALPESDPVVGCKESLASGCPAQTAQTLRLASLLGYHLYFYPRTVTLRPSTSPSPPRCRAQLVLVPTVLPIVPGVPGVLHRCHCTAPYCTVLYTCDQPTLMSSLPRKLVLLEYREKYLSLKKYLHLFYTLNFIGTLFWSSHFTTIL